MTTHIEVHVAGTSPDYACFRSAGARVPFVLMSGFEVDVRAERGDGTAVEFLAKPLTPADVTRVLSAVLAATTCSAT